MFLVGLASVSLGHFCLIDHKNRDAVPNRIDASATGAHQGSFVGGKPDWFAALGHGTDQDIEKLLDDHWRHFT